MIMGVPHFPSIDVPVTNDHNLNQQQFIISNLHA